VTNRLGTQKRLTFFYSVVREGVGHPELETVLRQGLEILTFQGNPKLRMYLSVLFTFILYEIII
jgi:hypothetical protein